MFRKHKGKFAAGSRGRTPGEQTPPGSQKKKGKAWKKVLLGVLLVLLALIVAIIIFVVTSLNKINRVDPNAETLSKEEWEQMRETDELDPNATYPAVDEDSITFSTTPDGQAIGAEDYIVNIMCFCFHHGSLCSIRTFTLHNATRKYFIQKVTICQETLAFSANYTDVFYFSRQFMSTFLHKTCIFKCCCIVFPVYGIL